MHTKLVVGIAVTVALVVVGGMFWRSGMLVSVQTYPDYTPGGHELEGTEWRWEKTEMNDGSVTTPRRVDAFTIAFTEDGKISGKTDCNSFFGSYTADRGALALSPLGMTKMYCEGSQEAEFIRMVGDSTQFIFTAPDSLVLLIKYDSGSVFFKRLAQ